MSDTVFTVLKRPIVTEKSNAIREDLNQYVFEVDRKANKVAIRHAVEELFGVKVLDVRTTVVRGKLKRLRRSWGKQPNWKKAIVVVREGDTIPLFEGA